jgi:hypothetical protein
MGVPEQYEPPEQQAPQGAFFTPENSHPAAK